jgi:arabinose-5-phosphate isomerase
MAGWIMGFPDETDSVLAPVAAPAAVADLAAARRVLEVEAAALGDMARGLDAAFSRAVDALVAAPGRVIVSGMGKSGHVGRKIAATFASTGAPAQFVHPAEASHGDLGMITAQDAVLALSNSGETPELADLVGHTRRFGIPLIAMVGRAASTLTQAADVTLLLPKVEEACPMGLAPTTSTTLMLALGDALAVALMGRRGFSVDDFRQLHPGGRLGRTLLRVSDLMHGRDGLPLVDRDAAMGEVLIEMSARGFGAAGVVDDGGNLVGIVTDGDLRRHMAPDFPALTAGQVMTGGPKTMQPSDFAAEALRLMNDHAITCLFVVDGTAPARPLGIVHIHDLLRAGIA